MAFYSLSEAEQHIMDYMWAHADQEEIHLNEIMEYMETKGYVWKQQTAYGSLLVFLRSLEGDHGLSEEHKQELQQFVKEQQEKEEERQKQEESSEKTE